MGALVRRAIVVVVAALGLVAVSATGAHAHALLLRSVPAGSTTVATAPSEVTLTFSEPVEGALARVRVYDVDGHRVDTDSLVRTDGGAVLHAGLAAKDDGTYTVSWQVTGGDGHTVSGGFEYYIGAPSSRSAVVVGITDDAGWTVDWMAGIGRFAWFIGIAAAVGTILVRRRVWNPVVASCGVADGVDASFRSASLRVVAAGAVVAPLGLLATLWAQAASTSGSRLVDALRWSRIDPVLHTRFGTSWIVCAIAAVVLAGAVSVLVRGRTTFGISPTVAVAVALGAGAAASIGVAFGGHARESEQPWMTVPATALHVAAMVIWLGGLVALATAGVAAWRAHERAGRGLVVQACARRFGRLALWSVVVLTGSGVVMALWQVTAFGELWDTTYGRLLLAKIAVFTLALGLAARHRFAAPAALEHGDDVEPVRRFARSLQLETLLVAVVVALGATLVAQIPARVVSDAAVPASDTATVGAFTASVFIDPGVVGLDQVHISFSDASGVAASAVRQVELSVTTPSGRSLPVTPQLLGPGHFAGTVRLTEPGRHRLVITLPATAGVTAASGSYDFTIRAA